MISGLLSDLKFALRMMRKAPAFTAVAVLSLGVGIGPNTAIFSLVNAVLFQEWGVGEPDGLVDVYSLTDDGRHFYSYYSIWELLDEGAGDVFQDVTAYTIYQGHIEHEGDGELVLGEMVMGNYFDVMRVPAALGRTFRPEEDATPGTHPVVVLSDRYWKARYGADPAVVGSDIRLNGRPYTVVGVAPAEFRGRIAPGVGTDFWVPLRMYPHLAPGQMSNGNLSITGRMRPGVPAARSLPAVATVASRFNETRPESRGEMRLAAVPLASIHLHPDMDRAIGAMAALLFVAVGLVLFIACANLAGFLLTRATDRRKEMAVRVAMGAGRGAIVRQLLVEVLLLAAMGGAVGLVLGQVAIRLLLAVDPPVDLPINLDISLSGRLLVFTGGASLLAALFFGLTPALESLRSPVAATLRDESAVGGRKAWARSLLVAGQMALSTVLLFGSALFFRSLQNAAGQDVGFSTAPAAVVTVETWANNYDDEAQRRFVQEIVTRVSSLPGVDGAAATWRLPLDLGNITTRVDAPGVEPPPDADHHSLEYTGVTPGYFEVMGIPILDGRSFTSADGSEDRPVVILSQAAAERFWPGESADGRTVFLGGDMEREHTVVGVVGDVKLWSLTETPRPYFYVPARQHSAYGTYHLVARGRAPAPELAASVRDEARALDPDIVLSDVGTMATHLNYIFFLPRMAALLLSVLGVMALGLAALGLSGMVSYAVARRTREVGIRLALGAERRRVVALVMRGAVVVVVAGGACGLVAAVALGRLADRFLIGVGALDPLALVAAPLALTAVAAVASYVPARRVSRVDPVLALRAD
jgi:predicted permease